MTLFWRYQLAFLGGCLAMSAHIFLTASRGIWFTPQHLEASISAGLIFGHIVALMICVARDLPKFLNNKLPVILTRLLSVFGGITFGILAWSAHLYLTLYQTQINWLIVCLGGIALSLGFITEPLIRIRNRYTKISLLIVITSISIFAPIYLNFQNYLQSLNTQNPAQALLYFQVDNPELVWLVGIPFALTIAVFGHLPTLFETNSSLNGVP